MKKNRVGIYCRLSREDMEKNKEFSESVENQKNMLIEYALSHDFNIYDVYIDDDFRGFDPTRPGFNRIINDAATGKIDIILCKSQSRFTRDMEMVERYIHGYFVEWGIRFISLTDNADTANEGNKKSRQINGLTNEWYSEDLSNNVKRVFRYKQENGLFIGAWAPYGYKKDPKEHNKLIIDPEAASVVREIFRLSIDGYGVQSIADILTKRGVLTPSEYKQKQNLNVHYKKKYKEWSDNSVRMILNNPTYTGDLTQHKHKKLSYKSSKIIALPEEQWIIVPNTHEPIISKEDFLLSQQKKQKRNCRKRKSDNTISVPHILAGKVFCKDCGNLMHRVTTSRKENKTYLICGRYKLSRRRECSIHSIRYDLLVDFVEQQIRRVIKLYLNAENKEMLEKEIEDDYLSKNIKKELDIIEKKQSDISKELDMISKALADAFLDKTKGDISILDFQSISDTLKTKKAEYMKESVELEKKKQELNNKLDKKSDIGNVIQKFINFKQLDITIIENFIDYIEIGNKDEDTGEQDVIIHWRF